MQQGKLLTAGEGGACVTDDLAIAEKMYLLRTDGRRHAGQVAPGRMELDDVGGVLGRNFCLSEFQAACLRAQLGELEDLNNQRWNTAQRLRAALADVPGVSLPRSSAGTERESYYHFIAFFEPAAFGDCPVEIVAEAISGELGFWVHPVYDPLYRHPLASLWLREGERSHSREEANRGNYPGCERVRSCAIAFHHPVLLAGDAGIARIIAAVEKVRANADSLPLSFRANRGATS
jgi:dTDP-4-amino-4,6-dideoxygalactose transaminase